MAYALTYPPNYKVDVSDDGVLKTFGVRLVQHSWCHLLLILWDENGYILEISSDDTVRNATIEGFNILRKLLRSEICTPACWPDNEHVVHTRWRPHVFATNVDYQISLCFNVAEALTLKNLRFDIVPLIGATLLSRNDCPITITVRHNSTNTSHTTTLR
jgi:hypothetical protein